MFMGNSSTNEKKLMLADGNLKTPSPLSSDSDHHGSSESLLSEINEVYQSIETNYPLTKAKSTKNLGIIQEKKETLSSSSKSSHSSSPSSLKKRLTNITPIVPDIPDNRSIIKDVIFDLQLKKNRIEEKEEPSSCEKESSWNSDTFRMIDARARRRAKLYTSSPEESFRGMSSEEDRPPKISIDPTTSQQINYALKNATQEDILASSNQKYPSNSNDETVNVLRKKSTFILDPIKRKKRRKDEIIPSSSVSQSTSPEPSNRKKTSFTGSFKIPQLNLDNIQSTDSSLRDQNDEDARRNREIDELVETLSNTSFRSTLRNRSSDEEAKVSLREKERADELRTFRVSRADVRRELDEGIGELSWTLKPTSGVTDLYSRKTDIHMNNYLRSYTNAATQVDVTCPLAQVHQVSNRDGNFSGNRGEIDNFSLETGNLRIKKEQVNLSSEPLRNGATEVIYENQNWQAVSSSGDETTPHSTPSRIIKYPMVKTRQIENTKWAQIVSPVANLTKHHVHDRYSVFFVPTPLGVSISQNVGDSGANSLLAPGRSLENQGRPPESDDGRESMVNECFCLKFCNLFRYSSNE